jgi:hypothetical protein
MTRILELPVEQQVASVASMSIGELHDVYRFLFPNGGLKLPRSYIQRKVAYRMQEIAFGGLDAITANKIKETRRDLKGDIQGARHPSRTPLAGTRLSRVYRGQRYNVIVGDGFFEYAGRRYSSLTAIAVEITGSKHNGWVFFGLKSNSKVGPA